MPVLTPAESIEQLSAETALLAEAVSLAIRIEPQLLRKMRLELFPGFDAGVEADLWFSPVVESRAASGIVLQRGVAEALRRRLGEKPAVLEDAWRVVETVHRRISPAVFAEERLAYLALSGKQDEMRGLLRSVVATLVSPRGRGLADWAAKAITRLPEEARALEEAQMLAFGASLRLGDAGPPAAGTEPARAAGWAAWLSPEDLEMIPFGVALLEGAVEFGPVGRPNSHRIELPKTSPVVAELGWNDGTRDRTERVVVSLTSVTLVELDPDVTQVDIRTVLGDSYWLTVPAARERESLQKKVSRVRTPRVHITYDVEIGAAIEKKELPFVVGVLADLAGSEIEERPPLRNRRFIEIDRDNFDDVMKAVGPRLQIEVKDRLRPDGGRMAIELRFESLRDFEPAAVGRQIEPTRKLLESRDLVHEALLMAQGNEKVATGLQRAFEEHRPVLDAVTVLMGAGVDPVRAMEMATHLLKSVPGESSDIEAAGQARMREIDAALSAQIREVLHAPDFQRLEATWRGLYYLVQQTETSNILKIRVLSVSKRELARDLQGASEFDQSSLFKKVYEEEFGLFGGTPFGVFVGAYPFGPDTEDVELIEAISQVAAASHAPFLADAGPAFFRLENFSTLSWPMRDLAAVTDSAELAKWRSFRESEDARYVGLTLPRIMLRLPYGRDWVPVEEFAFEEMEDYEITGNYLWGNSAFALAARITDAFAKYEWCAAIRGLEGGGLVEGLPTVFFHAGEGETGLQTGVETQITDRREKELSDLGFIPLVDYPGSDNAAFFSVNSVQTPRPYLAPEAEAAARLSVQLPYIFAVSRFAHFIQCMIRDKIGAFLSRSDVELFLNRWIAQYVLLDDQASENSKARFPLREARIDVDEVPNRPGTYQAIAFLRPHFQLDDLTVSLRVVVSLPSPAV